MKNISRGLQAGIYFEPKEKPPPCYRLLLLNVLNEASQASARGALTMVIGMLESLRRGDVRELEGQPRGLRTKGSQEQFETLDCLLGIGRRFFDDEIHAPPLTSAPRPEFLSYLPYPAFPMLPWADDAGTPSGPSGYRSAANGWARSRRGVHGGRGVEARSR